MFRTMAQVPHPITEYKRRHGLTNDEFAAQVSVSWRQIHRVEHGEQEITAKIAKKIEAGTNGELTAVTLLGLGAPERAA